MHLEIELFDKLQSINVHFQMVRSLRKHFYHRFWRFSSLGNACLFVQCDAGECIEDKTTADCFKCRCPPGLTGKLCETVFIILRIIFLSFLINNTLFFSYFQPLDAHRVVKMEVYAMEMFAHVLLVIQELTVNPKSVCYLVYTMKNNCWFYILKNWHHVIRVHAEHMVLVYKLIYQLDLRYFVIVQISGQANIVIPIYLVRISWFIYINYI
jgi:hypothetical protein